MKALKSERAKLLLEDPEATVRLMEYLLSDKARLGSKLQSPVIEVRAEGKKSFRVQPQIVGKAA